MDVEGALDDGRQRAWKQSALEFVRPITPEGSERGMGAWPLAVFFASITMRDASWTSDCRLMEKNPCQTPMTHRSDEIADGPRQRSGSSDRLNRCAQGQWGAELTRETQLVRRGESDRHGVWMSIWKEEVGNVRLERRG